MNISEFLDMGGYALFVWPAYVLSLVAITALVVASWRRMKIGRAHV